MNGPDQHPLQAVIDQIAPFDPLDLLATAGALQLIPENAERILRIPPVAGQGSGVDENQQCPYNESESYSGTYYLPWPSPSNPKLK